MNRDLERRHFLETIGRNGHARPRHAHIQARAEERAILEEMVAEGLLEHAYLKVDQHGYENPRGRSVRTVWKATEKGLPLAKAAKAEGAERLKRAREELEKDHTTLDSD